MKTDSMNSWQEAIDRELVCAHLGVAGDVSIEEASALLKSLIQWHIEVATDPLVNGGFTLQPEVSE